MPSPAAQTPYVHFHMCVCTHINTLTHKHTHTDRQRDCIASCLLQKNAYIAVRQTCMKINPD